MTSFAVEWPNRLRQRRRELWTYGRLIVSNPCCPVYPENRWQARLGSISRRISPLVDLAQPSSPPGRSSPLGPRSGFFDQLDAHYVAFDLRCKSLASSTRKGTRIM